MLAQFYIRNQFVGERALAPVEKGGRLFHHPSYSYICPQCGDSWAKIVTPGRAFTPVLRLCEEHGCGLLNGIATDLHLSFPREVLIREVRLLSNYSVQDDGHYMHLLMRTGN